MEEKKSEGAPQENPPKRSGVGALVDLVKHPLFKCAVAFLILAVLYFLGRFDIDKLKNAAKSWRWIVLGFALMVPGFFFSALRLQILLLGFGLQAKFRQVLSWTMIGAFFDVVMPSATGGDLIKVVYLVRAYGPGQKSVAGSSVLVDRFVGLVGLFFFGLLVCGFAWGMIAGDPKLQYVPYFLVTICLGTVIGFSIFSSLRFQESPTRQRFFSKLPMGDKLEKVYRALSGLRQKPRVIIGVLVLSILNHAGLCLSLVALSKGLAIDFPAVQGLAIFPLALFLNVFGFAGGFGAGELAFEYLMFHFLNTGKGAGTTLALVFHILAFIVRVVMGLPFYLVYGGEKETERDGVEAAPPTGQRPDHPNDRSSNLPPTQ